MRVLFKVNLNNFPLLYHILCYYMSFRVKWYIVTLFDMIEYDISHVFNALVLFFVVCFMTFTDLINSNDLITYDCFVIDSMLV